MVAAPARADAPAKRPLPDYDGRGPRPATLGDSILWGPRVVAAPLWATNEFLLRRPLGWLATTAERNHWPTKLLDLFTFDAERKSGVIPTAYYEYGFRPSVGLYFFWDEAFHPRNAIRAVGATWGRDWLSIAVRDRIQIVPGKSTFALTPSFVQRPDGLFAGLGPRSVESDVSRYAFRRIELAGEFEVVLWRASTFRARFGYRNQEFDAAGECCGDPSLAARVQEGRLTLPPGFAEGYTALFQSVELALDTRRAPPEPLTGVRFAANAEHGADVRDSRHRQWIRYGAQLGGFLDLNGKARVLGLVLSASLSDPIGAGPVPFTEQVVVGGGAFAAVLGFGPLRGFRPGRLIDRSAAALTLQYEWPIWAWANGTLHVATGNVWGTHFEAIDPKLLRFSTGLGIRSVGSPDHQFELLVGAGTETIEDGAKITSIRIVVGGTRGF